MTRVVKMHVESRNKDIVWQRSLLQREDLCEHKNFLEQTDDDAFPKVECSFMPISRKVCANWIG